MTIGSWTTFWIAVRAFAIISASLTRGTPTLTSRAPAPASISLRASATIKSVCPAAMASENFFFPVGLIFSPTIRKGTPGPTRVMWVRDEIFMRVGAGREMGEIPFSIRDKRRTYSGVVPQQPPIIFAPASTNCGAKRATSSAFAG